jgi:hypothetical protein
METRVEDEGVDCRWAAHGFWQQLHSVVGMLCPDE